LSHSSITGRSTGPGSSASCSRSRTTRFAGSRRSSSAAPTASVPAGARTSSAAAKNPRTFADALREVQDERGQASEEQKSSLVVSLSNHASAAPAHRAQDRDGRSENDQE